MGGREGEGHGCESAHYLMGVKRRRGQIQFIIYKGSLRHRVEDSADELIGGGRRSGGEGLGVVVCWWWEGGGCRPTSRTQETQATS